PEDITLKEQVFRDHVEGLTPSYRAEVRMRTKDGGWKWILTRGRIVEWTEDGRPKRVVGTHTDVTERRQAEEGLRERKNLLRSALEATSDGYWERDIPTWQIVMSGRWEEILGYSGEEIQRMPGDFQCLVHPEDREVIQQAYLDHIKGKAPTYWAEFRLHTRDGTWKWIRSQGRLVERTAEGKPKRMVGTHTDVSARREAQEALKKSEEQLRFILENSRDAIFQFSFFTLNYDYLSPTIQDVTGFSPEEIISHGFVWMRGRLHPEDREWLDREVDDALAPEPGKSAHEELRFRWMHQDGKYRWIDEHRKILRDDVGRALATVGTWQDVTKQVEAEQALRESEHRFRTLIESIPVPTAMVQGTRIVYVNSAQEKALGFTAKDYARMDFWEVFHPDTREIYKQQALARLRGEKVPTRYHCPFITKAGEKIWVDVMSQSVRFRGKPSTLVCFTDITRTRAASEQSQESERFLQNVFDSLRDVVCVIDRDLNILRVNRAAERAFSDILPLVGKKCHEVFHRNRRPCTDCPTVRAFKKGTPQGAEVQSMVHGETRLVEVRSYPIQSDGEEMHRVVEVARDVTDRRRTERNLERNAKISDALVRICQLFMMEEKGCLPEVLRILGEVLGADRCVAYLLERNQRTLRVHMSWVGEHIDDTFERPHSLDGDQLPRLIELARAGQNLVVPDVQKLERGISLTDVDTRCSISAYEGISPKLAGI
ncbi:PAS domain S-box protein, partial [bacterium]|nr:PAS domain S-box protein [bacterium]